MLDQFKYVSLLASAITCLHVGAANGAVPDAERWQAFNNSAIAEHIIPNYEVLAQQSALLVTSIGEYCDSNSDQAFIEAQMQFKKASQAWQKIQHIQFGPVTILMRNFSLQYWPDKKNLGGRQLNAILAETKVQDQQFDNEFFARASVAVKGYPAIERMLFDKKMLDGVADNPDYCALMQAISGHIADNTESIVSEWQAELDNYAQYGEEAMYESSLEAATEVLKALVEPIEAISDAKIAGPLGSELTKMRWRKSESWRSHQSIDNIRSNLAALQHLYSGISNSAEQLLIESGEKNLANTINEQFSQAQALLTKIKEPVNMKYTEAEFEQLQQLQNKLKRLSDNLLASMGPLQVKLGFNRRDGD
jgi:predicted lipoprotein